MHSAFLVFHRWVALVAAVFLAVIALSGAALVLEGPIARAHAPRVVPPAGRAPLPLDTLVARARASSGGGMAVFVGMGDRPDLAWSFGLVPTQKRGRPTEVTLNEYTGALLPTVRGPAPAVTFMRKIHVLHVALLSGRLGNAAVILFTISALLLVLTGIVVWWRDKVWRIRFTGSWKRVNFDLHHSLGIFAALVLLVITSTGVWVAFGQIDNLMRTLNRSPAITPATPLQPPAPAGSAVISLDSIAAIARAAVPGAAIVNIQLPPGPKAPAMVQLKYPEDRTPAGRSRVFIDKYRGTVLLAMNTRTAEMGQHMIDIKRSLHTGDLYGLPTQILWALASLVLATQAITGVLMWWNAQPARRASRRRAPPGSGVAGGDLRVTEPGATRLG